MSDPKRKYEQRVRAARTAETRRRIVEATVQLHREIGPRATTVAEIARRADVQRLTVYKHFPDDRSLFDACQAHWLAHVPPPDPATHAQVVDPNERTRAVLGDLYGWYRQVAPMLRNVIRDASALPDLAATLESHRRAVAETVELLLRGRRLRGARRQRTAGALSVALAFPTWETLPATGLEDAEAAAVATAMAAAAA